MPVPLGKACSTLYDGILPSRAGNGPVYNVPMIRVSIFLLACASAVFGADVTSASVSKIYDEQLSTVEHELVPLAEAMPAEKYNFAPTDGEFKGVRTFAQQVGHIAAVIYSVSASALGE